MVKRFLRTRSSPAICALMSAIPLTSAALWLSRLPEGNPESYVFPKNSVGVSGKDRLPNFYGVDLNSPIGEWKKAWRLACKTAEVQYRWHDGRHTFITRLDENPNVSEGTIRALAWHVSKKMLSE